MRSLVRHSSRVCRAARQSLPDSSVGKVSTCNAGDLGSIPGLGRSLGEGKGYPLQYSGLENSMDYIVHGVAKSWDTTEQISLYTFRQMLSSCVSRRTLGRDSACR